MGLSGDQVKAVQRTWGQATAKFGDGIGNAFFIRMFKDSPETLDKFAKFKGQSISDLDGSDGVKAHSAKVINKLGEIIASLEDSGKLGKLMAEHGDYHKKRSIGGNYMDHGANALIALLSEGLGDFSDSDKAAWKALMGDIKGSVA